MLEAITGAAAVCARRLAIAPGDRVAVVHNAPQERIATALAEAARDTGAEVVILEFEPATRHGEEPPAHVAEAMRRATAVLAPTSFSLSHTIARRTATDGGTRCATLPIITEEIFARAVPVDYAELERAGSLLAGALTAATNCRIVAPSGTDITFDLTGRVGSSDDARLDTPGSFGNLPAGEGYIAPLETRAEGVLVVDASLAGYGALARPLRIEVAAGRAVAAEGEAAEWLLAALDAGGPLGRHVAEIGIGTNPAAIVTGNILEDENVRGTVHVAFGSSAGIGGVNQASVHLDAVVRDPTIELDGRVVLDGGRLVL